jgi:hypothetical protein
MSFLNYLQKSSKNHVFAQAPLALRDYVFWVGHWLLVCNVILAELVRS